MGKVSEKEQKFFTVAMAGQPNTGKSTIFNSLTGSRQHVGNWPGKTVEKKTGIFLKDDVSYRIVDLPGTYSLSANSQEELVARNFIVRENPDLVVVVVDSSQLERSFYMAAEIISMRVPVIVALNMIDVSEKHGRSIDAKKLETSLGVKVVPMAASKGAGIADLVDAIKEAALNQQGTENRKNGFRLSDEFSEAAEKLVSEIDEFVPEPYHKDWVALKIMENDSEITDIIKKRMGENKWNALSEKFGFKRQGLTDIAQERYRRIKEIVSECLKKPAGDNNKKVIGKFDRFATNPIFGGLLSIVVILSGFVAAAFLGFSSVSMLYPFVSMAAGSVTLLLSDTMPVFSDMISQGIIPGLYLIFCMSAFVFGVLVIIGFLEDIGYLPRMAYVADVFMNRIGLHGKSFMPLFMGFGCNIASVMGSRVVDSSRQRFLTIFLSSIIPCPGVMVTCAFIISIFFSPVASVIVISMTGAVILQLLVTSFFIGHTVLEGQSSGMIMELPPYHRPDFKTIWNYAWLHYKGYLKKGGTLIATIIVVVWALSYFPDGNINDSYLSSFGKYLEPAGKLMGMDWKLLTCLFVASFSKEAALASMGVLYGLQPSDGSVMSIIMENISQGHASGHTELAGFLAESISKPSALAFIFAVLFSVPCFSTVGAIYFETKSLKWTLGVIIYYTAASFLWGVLAYNAGLFFF